MSDAESIDADTLKEILARYDEHVKENIRELDHARYETIPNDLRRREGESGGKAIHLTKDEVVRLVEWKLCVQLSPCYAQFQLDHDKLLRTASG